jgi:hypothetical protein
MELGLRARARRRGLSVEEISPQQFFADVMSGFSRTSPASAVSAGSANKEGRRGKHVAGIYCSLPWRSREPYWSDKFEYEACRIERTLGQCVVAVHHIGSTAVPGIFAKPIIDILLEVDGLQHWMRQGVGWRALDTKVWASMVSAAAAISERTIRPECAHIRFTHLNRPTRTSDGTGVSRLPDRVHQGTRNLGPHLDFGRK